MARSSSRMTKALGMLRALSSQNVQHTEDRSVNGEVSLETQVPAACDESLVGRVPRMES